MTSRENQFQWLGPVLGGLGINNDNLLTNLLLKGSNDLCNNDNIELMKITQEYIKDTRRL